MSAISLFRRIAFIVVAISFMVLLPACRPGGEAVSALPNVLFIPVDDLRPLELSCYGNTFSRTPNIERLASRGVVFERCYCQEAICNPSRASLLTGLRPDTLRVWDLKTRFRHTLPDVVTLPQYFKGQGYTTIWIGKTFHNSFPDTVSWTEKPHVDGFPFDPDAVYVNRENLEIQARKIKKMEAEGRKRDQLGHWYVKANATECGDTGEDDDYFDGAQTTLAIEKLRQLKKEGKPFFLSVGYYRPHLPFNAPRKYWDLYNRDSVPLASNPYPPKGSPVFAVHGDAELRSYSDQHDLPWPWEEAPDRERQKEIKHGYYASVSYIDAQVGRLLDELEALGLDGNTILVLGWDHGWKLGEHNSWGKMTNYEVDTRVPLIIAGAGVEAKGSRSRALTEFVDIYPTLCEMAGLPVPGKLHGTSMVPLLEDPSREWKEAAFSQYLYGRFGPSETREKERMGYAMRTDRYRYVEWYEWEGESGTRGAFIASELYDHATDPLENLNLAVDTSNTPLVSGLSERLNSLWR